MSRSVRQPELPRDEQADLPRGVMREIERALGKGPRSRDVCLALSVGSAAIDEERPDVALEYLEWAKDQAPRIAAIREAYGVALYLEERYQDALAELKAYRRMTGRTDQNHVAADCLRALGREADQVAVLADALMSDDTAPMDRRAEAAIVWAAALADAGAVSDARSILRRFASRVTLESGEPAARVHYVAADLAQRDGDAAAARTGFEAVRGIDPQYLDVTDRLAALDA
ncbi:MAG: hypothetical protein WDZ26_04025 [Nitriliruptoraceae bacterium]